MAIKKPLCRLKKVILISTWIGLSFTVITIMKAPRNDDGETTDDFPRSSQLLPLLPLDRGRQAVVPTSNKLKEKANSNQKKNGTDHCSKVAEEPKRVVKVVRVIRRVVQKVVTSDDSSKTNQKSALKFFNQASKWSSNKLENGNGTQLASEKLWTFNKMEAEKIYLLKQLLSKPWKPNIEELKQIREEILLEAKRRPDMVIMTQQNTVVDGDIAFYITSKTQVPDKTKNGTHFHMNDTIYSSLPKTPPFTERFRKCSLIGNSGALLNSSCGVEIDDADFVFRCNAAPIGRHGRDAGLKSNFTTFNPSIFHRRFGGLASDRNISYFLDQMREYSGMLWFPCLASYRYTGICLDTFMAYNNSENRFVQGHPDHFRAIWKFWEERNVSKIISTGFYIVNLALTVCDELHLYGFWPFPSQIGDDAVQSVPYHYFDNLQFGTSHAMSDEFMKLVQLHELGVLRLHNDVCRR